MTTSTETARREGDLVPALELLHRPLDYTNGAKCCSTCWNKQGLPHPWPCPTAEVIHPADLIDQQGRWTFDPHRPHTFAAIAPAIRA